MQAVAMALVGGCRLSSASSISVNDPVLYNTCRKKQCILRDSVLFYGAWARSAPTQLHPRIDRIGETNNPVTVGSTELVSLLNGRPI